ncbi:4'-phosphopantetheinyl transferase family protein [Streptomyces mirabilis]|uniref:4'-phosphopantetheinyl transferase family protein n=1 Tax=Streptomyces mirabilis TaxID=68239 RepID=UPI0033B22988
MITDVLPTGVSAVEMFGDPWSAPPLFAQEMPLVERVVDRRRHEFATTRACARKAMSKLGFTPSPILRGSHGEPLWPTGLVGSLTHCEGYRAAVLARIEDMAAVGVDAEANSPLPENGP